MIPACVEVTWGCQRVIIRYPYTVQASASRRVSDMNGPEPYTTRLRIPPPATTSGTSTAPFTANITVATLAASFRANLTLSTHRYLLVNNTHATIIFYITRS